MPTKEELQALHPVLLPVMCTRVWEDASKDESTRAKAWELVKEWTRLQKPPNPSLKEQRKVEAQQKAKKARMVDFLAAL